MLARLIDGSAFVHRAYHAMPKMERPSDNHPVGAVNGFCRTLLKFVRQKDARFTAIIFDASRANWRHEIYPDYKAHRPPLEEPLRMQMPLMRSATKAFGIQAIEAAGYEADDILATYARIFVAMSCDVEIVTGDKDLCQLIRYENGAHVRVLSPFEKDPETGFCRAEILTDEHIEKKFGKVDGVRPHHVADLLALMGDASDNVPGVPSVGIKTAAKLIVEYGSLDALYERLDEISAPKLRAALHEHEALARLSRQLVALDENVPYQLIPEPGELEFYEPEWEPVRAFFDEMEFVELAKQIPMQQAA